MAPQTCALLVVGVLFLSTASARPIQDGDRTDNLIGYKEQDNGAGGAAGGSDAVAGGAQQQQAAVPERIVALHTQFGTIPIRLLTDLAPKTTSMVWDLALQRGCHSCAFYRNEPKPGPGSNGPPYALLQGRIDMPEAAVAGEGAVGVKTGHVAFIPGSKDFLIAYGDHPEWGTGHVVFGEALDWFAVDMMIQQRYSIYKHPEHGTEMRMLLKEVPFKISTKEDKTYTDAIGPLVEL